MIDTYVNSGTQYQVYVLGKLAIAHFGSFSSNLSIGSSNVGTIPSGYRPANRVSNVSYVGSAELYIAIYSNGTVSVTTTGEMSVYGHVLIPYIIP